MTPPPPQGWYPDPTGPPDILRFWNGSAWTEHLHHVQTQLAPAPPPYMARPQVTKVELPELTQRTMRLETTFVMLAFLVPGITAAVIAFAQHLSGVGTVTRFPVIIRGHPLENMLLGMVAYLSTACLVPLALVLLSRTGQTPSVLGLQLRGLRSELGPALGIGAASFGTSILVLIPFAPFIHKNSRLVSPIPVGTVPHYYLIWGLMIAATTAVAEEVLMNGYLMTRLSQLGWSPNGALILAIVLRTSYHVYYGIGFVATIPFTYFVTRSFQKRGRLLRPVLAHFLYDAVLISISVFAH